MTAGQNGAGLRRLVATGLVALGLAASARAQDGTPPGSPPPRTAQAPAARDYRFLDDVDALVSAWSGSGLVERLDLGRSAGDRELFAMQFGAPGAVPLAERTTVLLIGALDGVSIAGSEAVLAITEALLGAPGALPGDVTFVAVPWANPDGRARWLATGFPDGRNDAPRDDDRDGVLDEDPGDDVDGDGLVLEMLLEDADGAWVRPEDGRFLRPAREGEAPRYTRTREGRDDDGDGSFNEDGQGGVVIDRDFPVNWSGPWSGSPAGPWPLSQPETRALVELALARRTAIVLVFQGNHGRLAVPGGLPAGDDVVALPFASDEPTLRAAQELFTGATGRAASGLAPLHEVHAGVRPGSLIDWCYTALGALALEVGVWGPDVAGARSSSVEGQFPREPREGAGALATDGATTQEGRPAASLLDRDWARWLDETRGGLGFVEWQPVDLGDGRQGLVGGWEPYTRLNPPADVLGTALHGLDAFVLALVRGLPRFELVIEERRRDGLVGVLRVRLRNTGALPSAVGPAGPGLGTRLRLELPAGVQLLSGDEVVEVGQLPGQGRSETHDWLVVGPEDSVFVLVVDSPWGPPVRQEVRL